jgi:D-lactate dehydrogenase
VAKNFGVLTHSARFGVRLGLGFNQFLGKNFMRNLTVKSRFLSVKIPLWSNQLEKGLMFSVAKQPQKRLLETTTIIYFPSCITQMMGGDLMQRFYAVCEKAKINIVLPPSLGNNCCGQLFGSKGFSEAHRYKVNETIAELWAITEGGRLAVVTDVTSCTATLQQCRPYLTAENQRFFDQLKIFDSIDFASDVLLSRLNIGKKKATIVFHPVCSAYKMGLVEKLRLVGQSCAEQAVIPDMAGCCGMAGDRGFFIPELTNAATKLEATEVKQQDFDGYYSSAKTCEMNFSEAVGKNYQSILVLLDEVSI